MKRVLLGLALVLGASSANAAGLYLSAGYGKSDPDLSYTTKSKCSDPTNQTMCTVESEGYEESLKELPGFPNGYKLADYNSSKKIGYQAADWGAGLNEKYDYNTNGGETMALAVGWDISQNPFRFELEYQKTKFKSPGYRWTVVDPEGNYFMGKYSNDVDESNPEGYTNCLNGVCVNLNKSLPASEYNFDVSFYQEMSASVDSLMANAYFEIPGFGPIDPYIGLGIGKAKVEFDFAVPEADENGTITGVSNLSGGSDGMVAAKQLILGVEYRFEESPLIAGIEYRQFKTDFDERDDKTPYKFEHKYVMLKLRYDFISDEY